MFLLTESALLPQDTDTAFDIYDARIRGAESPCQTVPGATSVAVHEAAAWPARARRRQRRLWPGREAPTLPGPANPVRRRSGSTSRAREKTSKLEAQEVTRKAAACQGDLELPTRYRHSKLQTAALRTGSLGNRYALLLKRLGPKQGLARRHRSARRRGVRTRHEVPGDRDRRSPGREARTACRRSSLSMATMLGTQLTCGTFGRKPLAPWFGLGAGNSPGEPSAWTGGGCSEPCRVSNLGDAPIDGDHYPDRGLKDTLPQGMTVIFDPVGIRKGPAAGRMLHSRVSRAATAAGWYPYEQLTDRDSHVKGGRSRLAFDASVARTSRAPKAGVHQSVSRDPANSPSERPAYPVWPSRTTNSRSF